MDRYEGFELSVAEYIGQLNSFLRQQAAVIVGEVYGPVQKRPGASYAFFTVKDLAEDAILSCFAWETVLRKLDIPLEEGMKVKLGGYVDIYQKSGRLSFQAQTIILSGEGVLKRQFEALVARLRAEGLFAPERKRVLPTLPKKIGLVTSAGREAQTDFLTHLAAYGLEVRFVDSRVEGAYAVENLIQAIQYLNSHYPDTDVLVLTRGGGSLESLAAFNSEALARAITASKIPVICGVGHENDVTVADLVADARASTPTHAAKLISSLWEEAERGLAATGRELASAADRHFVSLKHSLERSELALLSACSAAFGERRRYLESLASQLTLSDPGLKLKQGYSITTDSKGNIVRSIKGLSAGDRLHIRLKDGSVGARIKKILNPKH